MAGFDRDEKVERMRDQYLKVKKRVGHHIDGIISIYQFMQEMKYTLQQHPEFDAEHVAQLESEFDEIKTRLGNLLQNAPENLPVGSNDLISKNEGLV